jgi:hypothetical protein
MDGRITQPESELIEEVAPPQGDQTKYREYMREYMRNKYQEDKEKFRRQKRTERLRRKEEVPDEDLKRYGNHTADIIKVRRLLETIPAEFHAQILPIN